MAVPGGKPVRKAARVGNTNLGAPNPGRNGEAYNSNRRAAKPFSSGPGKAAYVRKSAGVTPSSHNINRPDEKSRLKQGRGNVGKMKGVD